MRAAWDVAKHKPRRPESHRWGGHQAVTADSTHEYRKTGALRAGEASELVQQILSFVGQLPDSRLVDPKATKIVNKTMHVERETALDESGKGRRGP